MVHRIVIDYLGEDGGKTAHYMLRSVDMIMRTGSWDRKGERMTRCGPAENISAAELVRYKPNAECCECGREALDAPESSMWTVWRGIHVYCPKCAEDEGIGADG